MSRRTSKLTVAKNAARCAIVQDAVKRPLDTVAVRIVSESASEAYTMWLTSYDFVDDAVCVLEAGLVLALDNSVS